MWQFKASFERKGDRNAVEGAYRCGGITHHQKPLSNHLQVVFGKQKNKGPDFIEPYVIKFVYLFSEKSNKTGQWSEQYDVCKFITIFVRNTFTLEVVKKKSIFLDGEPPISSDEPTLCAARNNKPSLNEWNLVSSTIPSPIIK